MRTLMIAGNWKLNPTTTEGAVALAEAVKTGIGTATDVHVAVGPPFVFLSKIDQVLEGAGEGALAQTVQGEDAAAMHGLLQKLGGRRACGVGERGHRRSRAAKGCNGAVAISDSGAMGALLAMLFRAP